MLLNDPNESVFQAVETRLLDLGGEVLPKLRIANKLSKDDIFKKQSSSIIDRIAFTHSFTMFRKWLKNNNSHNLFDGAFWVAKYIYPELDYHTTLNKINNIADDAWLQMNKNLTPLEQIKVLNHIIYNIHKFNRSTESLYKLENSCINKVIERKKGNPVSLAIIYLIIARKVGLPMYGVNLPRNFIVAYVENTHKTTSSYNLKDMIVSFYANPYQNGAVLTKREIDIFLQQQKIKPIPQFFNPCDDKIAIQRMLLNLFIFYKQKKDLKKRDDIQKFINEFKEQLPNYNM